MKRLDRCPILLTLLLATAPASAAVEVVYGNPDRFTDAGDRNNDPVNVMKELEGFLSGLGQRYLPPGTDLRIEVLDLDRAGRPYMNLPTEIRVMSGKADIPCIDLRYTLVVGGRPSEPKRERVCDNDYLRPLPVRSDEHDPLVYEKRMLEEWFSRAFSAPPARPSR
jgi:hypothetical protein